MKTCNTCGIELNENNSYNWTKSIFKCKECQKNYKKSYKNKNKDKVKQWKKTYREKHKKPKYCSTCNILLTLQNSVLKGKKCFACKKLTGRLADERYNKKYPGKKQLRIRQHYHKTKNIPEVKEKRRLSRLKQLQNPYNRLVNSLRNRKRKTLNNALHKLLHTKQLLSASQETLIIHLSKQFLEGMSWENYGQNGWELDHIVPISYFDLTIEENIKICFHYLNLQPLWAKDNWNKSDNLPNNYLEIIEKIEKELGVKMIPKRVGI